MHQISSFVLADLCNNGIPLSDTWFFLLFIVLMFMLEAVISEMNHKLVLVLYVLFIVFLDSKTQISWMEKYNIRSAVHQHITPDIKFTTINQQRSNILLDQSIVFEFSILILLFFLLLLCFFEHVWLVIKHVVKWVFTKVEFFWLDELFLKLINICDHPNTSTLV